jgi:hypothetical protein
LPDSVDTSNFLRADVAIVSWAALEADLKAGTQRLAQKLIDEKIFASDAYAQAVALIGEEGRQPCRCPPLRRSRPRCPTAL